MYLFQVWLEITADIYYLVAEVSHERFDIKAGKRQDK